MKNNIVFLLMLCLWNNVSFAQKTGLDVREQNLSEFPLVKGKLWARNPDGIKTESVSFYENDLPYEPLVKFWKKSIYIRVL